MLQVVKNRIEEINSGRVSEGYKQTPFGIFPSDWEIDKTLKDFALINPKTSKLPIEFLYIDLESVIDGRIVKENIINRNNAPSRAQRVLSENDVIYQMVRPYQRNNLIFHNSNKEIPSVASTGYAQLRSNIPSFLFQIINSDYFCEQVLSKCTGTNYPAINSEDLGTIMIAYPKSKTEQGKIAEILMKWDEMVELQEQYITKLEIRKKAVMKKLLTPKDGWESVKLGDICNIKTGKRDANAMVEDGEYPFFTCSKDIFSIDTYSFDCEALLMAGNGDIGDIKYYKGKFDAYQRTYVLYNFSFNIKYVMHYLLLNFDKDVMKGMQKSSMPYIKLELLQKATVYFNKTTIDKTVRILESIDEEISLQKEKLEKIKAQRKILQQYLLTGIVRVGV